MMSLFALNLHAQKPQEITEVNYIAGPKFYIHVNNLCHGRMTGYHSNGRIAIEGRFKNGIPKGIIYNFNNLGRLASIRYFKRGEVAKTEVYDDAGRLTQIIDVRRHRKIVYYYLDSDIATLKEVFVWENAHPSRGTRRIYTNTEDGWFELRNDYVGEVE